MMVSEVSLNGWKSFYKVFTLLLIWFSHTSSTVFCVSYRVQFECNMLQTVYNAVCLANVCRTHADVTADIGIFDKVS